MCGGGGGGGSSGGGSASAFGVKLTFAPIPGGFVIANQSDFGSFVSLNITATPTSGGGRVIEDANINISRQFIGSSYDFTGLDDQSNYTFRIIGTLSDRRQQEVKIVFTWEENEEDYNKGGIRPGINTDGDGRANSVDEDDDNDGIRDDEGDDCSAGDIDWMSNSSSDHDGDGCRDAGEDTDDDNDGLEDDDVREGLSNSDGATCSLLADCDGDSVIDGMDIDADGDGLIEIGTHEELNAIRYALNGNGSRSAANAALDTTGCGGDGGTTCSGYELVADISLANYRAGKGWQPLGHDTDDATSDCQGAAFDGTFEGNGWTISDLNISRLDEDCVGLFGRVTANSEIRNLTLRAERVIGRASVGGLVGDGRSARIVSSSVVVGEIRGSNSAAGLVGNGQSARIHSSSVVVAEIKGSGNLLSLSSDRQLGGLVGWGTLAQIHSSSVVVGQVSGIGRIGGLVGNGNSVHIYSSLAVIGEVNGSDQIGGLVGDGNSVHIYSSSVVVGEVSGNDDVGGLAGIFNSDSRVAYSYVVSGSNTKMLAGGGSGTGVASYWDSETSGVSSGNHGAPQTTSALRMPIDYTGIYASWDEDMDIFGNEDEPLAVWCDKDNSGNIEAGEKEDDNRIWDFGTSNQYPAIRCTPISPTEWRNWWSLVNGKPQLNQTRLSDELNK